MSGVSRFQSFLAYRHYRYLKWSLAALAVSIGAYAAHEPVGVPNGGSVVGYSFGTIAAGLIVWLLAYGVRKRSYAATGAPLQGWLSAHVYLGLWLLILVPLHAGFQFGWNVHTLSYVLICGTVVSGFGAVIFYATIPSRMTTNRPGQKLEALLEQIADIDAECRSEVTGLPDHFANAISMAINETHIGGSTLRQFSLRDPKCGTLRAIDLIRKAGFELRHADRGQIQKLLELLSIKSDLLGRVRRDTRHRASLDVWMLFHVPLSLATAVAVGIHILAVFYYR